MVAHSQASSSLSSTVHVLPCVPPPGHSFDLTLPCWPAALGPYPKLCCPVSVIIMHTYTCTCSATLNSHGVTSTCRVQTTREMFTSNITLRGWARGGASYSVVELVSLNKVQPVLSQICDFWLLSVKTTELKKTSKVDHKHSTVYLLALKG